MSEIDIKSVPELLKLQDTLRARFESLLDTSRPDRKPPDPEELVAQRESDMARANALLADAKNQRDVIVKQWDERIAKLQERVDRQKDEIRMVKDGVKSARPEKPEQPERPEKPVKPKSPGRRAKK